MYLQILQYILIAVLAGFCIDKAQAQDGGRILNELMGAGARILLHEMSRERTPETKHRPASRENVQVEPDRVPLNRREMQELQRALIALGFDIGAVDGRAGRKTGAAISQFLSEKGLDPYEVPIREAKRLILAGVSTNSPKTEIVATASSLDSTSSMQGMPIRDGAVLFATQTNHALRSRIGGGDADRYDRSVDLFGRLLVLSGAPQFLDDAEKTDFFLPLVRLEELSPYIDANALELTAQYGNSHLDEWRGDNQFAKEDSRKAFLTAYRDKLVAQAPPLPLRIDIVRSVRFGKYDGSSIELDVDSQDVFPHYGQVGLTAVEPFERLNKWVLNEVDARRVVEAQSEVLGKDSYDGPVIVTRAEITSIRSTKTGVILDIAAIDITAYATATLDRPLGQLPMPPNAVVKNADGSSPINGLDGGVPFDPVFVRMLAAKEQAALASNDGFHFETFRMRRASENQTRNSGRKMAVDWPKLIPASLVATNENPSPADLLTMAKWFDGAREKLTYDAQLAGFCWFDSRESDQCVLPSDATQQDGTIALKSLVAGSVRSWDYGWNGLPDDSDIVVKQAYPNAGDFIPFGAGRDIPGMIVLQQHPAWFSVPFEVDKLSEVILDIRVVSHRILGTPSGKGFIAIEIAPLSIRYLSDGKWKKLNIAPTAEKVAGGTLDAIGLKVGMPLEAAKAILTKHFEGRAAGALASKSSGSDPVFGEEDPIFGEMLTFKTYASGSMPETVGAEAVRVFFDKSQPEKPVLAVDRSIRFAADLSDNASQRAEGKPVMDGLVAKYGTPDRQADLADSSTPTMWAVEPTAKARIKSGKDFCTPNIWLSTTYYYDSPSHSGQIVNDCGEIHSVWFRHGIVSQLLMDTNAILKLRQHFLSERQTKAAAEKAAQPAIKF